MAVSRGTKEYGPPVRGLNTEASVIDFPQDFFVDGVNVVIDKGPVRLAVRKGLSEASGFLGSSATTAPNPEQSAIHAFRWDNVAEDPDRIFLCVQLAGILYFQNYSTGSGQARENFAVDLKQLKSGTSLGTDSIVEQTKIDFTVVKGNLLIVSKAIDPTIIEYDATGNTITITKIVLEIRDFEGVEDGLAIEEEPTALTEEHNYNLLNQGWAKQVRIKGSGNNDRTSPITAYSSATMRFPSNAQIPHVAVIDDGNGENRFDAEALEDINFGTTPAPRGHYIYNAFSIDRQNIVDNPDTNTGSQDFGGTAGSGGTDVPPTNIP